MESLKPCARVSPLLNKHSVILLCICVCRQYANKEGCVRISDAGHLHNGTNKITVPDMLKTLRCVRAIHDLSSQRMWQIVCRSYSSCARHTWV